jgi:hypothetical protein
MINNRIFFALLDSFGLPPPIPEYKFCPTRGWKSDYAYPDKHLLLEVEGGLYVQKKVNKKGEVYYSKGAHGSLSGMQRDIEKYSEAACLGYRIIRVQPDDLLTTKTMKLIKRAYNYDC